VNTFAANASSRRPSRLVDLIRGLTANRGGASVGFRPRPGARKRSTALIASFPFVDIDGLKAAAEAGADALEISVSSAKDMRGLSDLANKVSVPVGMALTKAADSTMALAAADAGADWVRVPFDAPVSSMEWERPSRMLTVPFSLDLELAQAVNGLGVDVILIDRADGPRAEFTYIDALRLRALSAAIKKPVLVDVGAGLPSGAASAAEHLGADGLFVVLDGLRSIDTLREYVEALERPLAETK